MLFNATEIALARRLRQCGLQWVPAVGHYVLDETDLIEAPSPFQDGVYFILDLKHFLRRCENVDQLQQRLLWLPQWHQARETGRELGISDAAMAERLHSERALESGTELAALYTLIIEALSTPGETSVQ